MQGSEELVDLLVQWSVTTLLLVLLYCWDERRLTEEQLARAWPIATKRIAIYFVGLLAVPIHFTRTRRSILGFFLGIAWMIAVMILTVLIASAIESLLGISIE